MKHKFFAVLATWGSLVALPAHAALITWTLQNVAFDDGGKATGFFTLDPTMAGVSDFDISTTPGTKLPGNHYDSRDFNSHLFADFEPNDGGASVLRIGNGFTSGGNEQVLRFNFVPTLATSGTTPISVAEFPSTGEGPVMPGQSNEFWFKDIDGPVRFIVSPSSVKSLGVIPEPASLVFVGLGVGLLMLLRKRMN